MRVRASRSRCETLAGGSIRRYSGSGDGGGDGGGGRIVFLGGGCSGTFTDLAPNDCALAHALARSKRASSGTGAGTFAAEVTAGGAVRAVVGCLSTTAAAVFSFL